LCYEDWKTGTGAVSEVVGAAKTLRRTILLVGEEQNEYERNEMKIKIKNSSLAWLTF
jgi:hypothetical protein